MTTETQSTITSNEETNFKSSQAVTTREARTNLSSERASAHFKTLSLRPTKSIKKKCSARPIRKIK